jgi:hypothetical protein
MNEQFKQPVSGFEVGQLRDDVLTMARTTVEGAREVFSTASEVASKEPSSGTMLLSQIMVPRTRSPRNAWRT